MKHFLKLDFLMLVTLIFVFGTAFFVISSITFLFGLPATWALSIFLVIVFLQWYMAPRIVEGSLRLRYLGEGEIPWLEDMVGELAGKAGIPKPEIAVFHDPDPNAFVFGRSRGSSTLVLHRGLIEDLERGEIRAVIAHELGHIKRYDCSVLTVVSLGPLILQSLSNTFLDSAEESLGRGACDLVFAFIFYVLALTFHVGYFLTNLLVLWLSRSREYYADAFSAYLTGKPHSLETALAKISYGLAVGEESKNKLRIFCIEDQLLARKEIYEVMENKDIYDLDRNGVLDRHEIELAMKKEYDLNRDGRLDGHELQLAMKKEVRGIFNRLNEIMSTHPPTYRRIMLLDQIGKGMSA
jgi:heat shock protein HtpX